MNPKGCWFESNWRSSTAGDTPAEALRSTEQRSNHRKRNTNSSTAARILTTAALALATIMGLLAVPASAASGPPPQSMKPVYDLYTGYWVLRDWGVPGNEQQVTALLVDTCDRMSNDLPTLTALQASLSQQYTSKFGGQGGNILAIASDTLCPQYQPGVANLAWFVDGARW